MKRLLGLAIVLCLVFIFKDVNQVLEANGIINPSENTAFVFPFSAGLPQPFKGHTKNKRKSNQEKHEKGDARRQADQRRKQEREQQNKKQKG